MPIKETNYHNDKSKAKYFTGGKPKDFLFTPQNNSTADVRGIMATGGKAYLISTNATFDAKGLHELAAHLEELAGILDGTVSA